MINMRRGILNHYPLKDASILPFIESIDDVHKMKKAGCAECYSNTLCRQCIAENYFSNGNFFVVPKKKCEFTMSKTEKIISNVVKEKMTK